MLQQCGFNRKWLTSFELESDVVLLLICTYAICQQDVDMMLRAKVVVGLSYKLKSHIPKWGNEPHVVMERGGKVRGKSLNFH